MGHAGVALLPSPQPQKAVVLTFQSVKTQKTRCFAHYYEDVGRTGLRPLHQRKPWFVCSWSTGSRRCADEVLSKSSGVCSSSHLRLQPRTDGVTRMLESSALAQLVKGALFKNDKSPLRWRRTPECCAFPLRTKCTRIWDDAAQQTTSLHHEGEARRTFVPSVLDVCSRSTIHHRRTLQVAQSIASTNAPLPCCAPTLRHEDVQWQAHSSQSQPKGSHQRRGLTDAERLRKNDAQRPLSSRERDSRWPRVGNVVKMLPAPPRRQEMHVFVVICENWRQCVSSSRVRSFHVGEAPDSWDWC